jgi:hypothetical protein
VAGLLTGVTVVAGMTGSADGVADGVVVPIADVGSGVADRLDSQVPAFPSAVAVTTITSYPVATATPVAENVMAIKARTPVWRKVRMVCPSGLDFRRHGAIVEIEHCGLISVSGSWSMRSTPQPQPST